MEPTEKQLAYIDAIEKLTGYKFEREGATKKTASDYIDKHIEEFRLKSKPTEKQLAFIADIEELTGHQFEREGTTKKAASDYIDKHIEEYIYELKNLECMTVWDLNNG